MTKRRIVSLVIITAAAAVLVTFTVIFFNNFRGIIPLLKRPAVDITEAIPESSTESGEKQDDLVEQEDTGAAELENAVTGEVKSSQEGEQDDSGVLKLDEGFSISVFSGEVPAARVLCLGPTGSLWVSQTGIGKVSRIDIENGRSSGTFTVFEGLNNPHGLVFDPENPGILYIAQEDKISRVVMGSDGFPAGDLEKVIDLPAGGRHYTRTLGFGSDGRLYVSVGSTCDVCIEKDDRIASIYSMEKDGSDFREFATGLRNSVFFRWNPATGQMWATEMGRDNLGDDLPPDEINIILEGRDYGWPYCYGNNIQDRDFDSSETAAQRCRDAQPSFIDIQAHSAPLGLDFIPSGDGWPREYHYDLLVSYHGSWNRSVPTGYKVVRFVLDSSGNLMGEKDFITGWLADDGSVLGRPVDILVLDEGIAYISDDRAGVVYKVEHRG